MMKKVSMIFVILVLLLVPSVVFGDEEQKSHIMLIESFDISGSEIIVEGYSFISHVDNWGGKNLNTYIMAYTGTWNNSWLNPQSCSNDANCVSFSTKPVKDDDGESMFYSRCTDVGCLYHKEYKENFNSNTVDNKCSGVISYGSSKKDSDCLYEDVRFKGTIELSKISKKIGNSNIKLRVVSVNRDFTGNNSNALSSSFSLFASACKKNGNSCGKPGDGGNLKVTTNDYIINFSKVSSSVFFDASSGTVFVEDNGALKRKSYRYFMESTSIDNKTYEVLDWTGKKEYFKTVKYDKSGNSTDNGTFAGKYQDSYFQLNSQLIECGGVGNNLKNVCYHVYDEKYSYACNTNILNWHDGKCYYGDIVYPNDYNSVSGDKTVDYWAPANFITFSGELEINLQEPAKKLSCGDFGFSADKDDSIIDNCDDKKDSAKECIKETNVSSEIYIRAGTDAVMNSSAFLYERVENEYYHIIDVVTDVVFNQTAEFYFGEFPEKEVYAGKGFALGAITYENTITWAIAKMNVNNKKPYYQYSSKTLDFDINDNYVYYYYDYDGGWHDTTDLSVASLGAIGRKVMSSTDYIEKNINDKIIFESCDSNDASDCKIDDNGKISGGVDVSGSWSGSEKISDYELDKIKFGKQITGNYSYTLADSYVGVIGDDYAKALYGKEADSKIEDLVATGKKFYIDFRWVYEADWPFNLKNNINPSFVKGMSWSLNGICSVDVKDGYYKNASGDDDDIKLGLNYRYRSISLSNPFPKANSDFTNIAVNWQDWYRGNITNQTRIRNTYENGTKYEITISRNGIDGKNKISDIINNRFGNGFVNRYYSELDYFYNDGRSMFVNGDNGFYHIEFDNKESSNSYCGLGYFSTRCDNY